jgi:metal-responsive CopG/Arc/MetJ family transcriptional regulator
MGRTPFKSKPRPTTVQLSPDLLRRIDDLVGTSPKYQRSKFIREAVEAELERRERQKP